MNLNKFLFFILILFFLFSFGCIQEKKPIQYKHKVEEQGILFASNSLDINSSINLFKKFNKVIIVANVNDDLQQVVQLIVLNQVVFSGNNIETIVVLKSKEKDIEFCQTDYGKGVNERISIEDCNQLIQSNPRIVLNSPSPKTKSIVFFDGLQVSFTASSFSEMYSANLMFLKALFPNADQVINAVNKKISGV